jgi:hypothetical protein
VTSASWEHNDEVGEALRAIVADPEYGVEALSSSQTMSNLLKDYLPGAPRERGVLVAAAEAGLAQVLADRVAQGMDIATAESLATSDLAAQAPFTPEACHWAVAEISAALGLRPPGGAEMPPPGGATVPPADATAPPSGATAPPSGATARPAGATVPPGGATVPPVGATIPPAGRAGGGAGAATALAADAGTGSAGTGAMGAGTAGTGPAGGGPGARPTPRVPKAAWAVVAAVVVVVVVVVAVALSGHPAQAAPVTPLATMLSPVTGGSDPAVIDCRHASLTGLSGVSADVYCLGSSSTGINGIKAEAYQFSTTADYQAGLSYLNHFFGYDPTGAAQGCSKDSNTTCDAQWWQDPKYPRAAGQNLEELYTVNSSGDHPTDIWTLPGQRVVFAAQDAITDSTIPDLYGWWVSLPNLICKVGCG